MPDFVHLHVHSQGSLLDGYARVKDLVAAAKADGQRALALTDHGNLFLAVPFYRACRAAGITPIIGCELYWAPDRRARSGGGSGDRAYDHLLVLAETTEGYHNLIKLVSAANVEGYYYKPRVDDDLLGRFGTGLIATSGCLGGTTARLWRAEDFAAADARVAWMAEHFPGRFYLEVQRHGDGRPHAQQLEYNDWVYGAADRHGLPVVATNDAHYARHADHDAHDLMLCVQTRSPRSKLDRFKFDSDQYYLKTADEMAALFREVDLDVFGPTVEIAERCRVEIPLGGNLLPEFAPADGSRPDAYLRRLVDEGLRRRYGDPGEAERARAARELAVIEGKGYVSYFLIVADYVAYARSIGADCVARGSVAGSIVAYALGISGVDPIRYDIPFERFLNPDRPSYPDIDLDVRDDRRDAVIAYIANRYGRDKVAQILTYNVSAAKAAVRDVGRALEEPKAADRVARAMPVGATDARAWVTPANDAERRVVEGARALEGTIRSTGVHAAGVVVSRVPLIDVVPVAPRDRKDPDSWLVAQAEQADLEALGLIKMDVLGVANLTTLRRVVDLVVAHEGGRVDLDTIPIDDPATLALLSEGRTTGVFQLESAGMRRWLKQLRPRDARDVMAMVALYRPGPMDSIGAFVAARHGRIAPEYLHPAMREILADTYGCLVYQDQILLTAVRVAGFTWGEVDGLRKAMGKKLADVMARYEEQFLAGCQTHGGLSPEAARKLWGIIEPFSQYAFGRGHASDYGWRAYQNAYLKAHYPACFFCATLTTEASDAEKVEAAVRECRAMGVPVLPPDVNRSQIGFAVERLDDGRLGVRFGLSAIKSLGEKAAAGLFAARAEAPFSDLDDFVARAHGRGVNRGVLKRLIECGACDAFGPSRAALLRDLDALTLGTKKARAAAAAGAVAPEDDARRAAWEAEHLGVAVSVDPLAARAEALARARTHTVEEVLADPAALAEERTTLAGVLRGVRVVTTRSGGDQMAVGTLDDGTGALAVVAFPRVYRSRTATLASGRLVRLEGTVGLREEEPQLVIAAATPLDADADEAPAPDADPLDGLTAGAPIAVYVRRANARAYGGLEDFFRRRAVKGGGTRWEVWRETVEGVAPAAPQLTDATWGWGGIEPTSEALAELAVLLGDARCVVGWPAGVVVAAP